MQGAGGLVRRWISSVGDSMNDNWEEANLLERGSNQKTLSPCQKPNRLLLKPPPDLTQPSHLMTKTWSCRSKESCTIKLKHVQLGYFYICHWNPSNWYPRVVKQGIDDDVFHVTRQRANDAQCILCMTRKNMEVETHQWRYTAHLLKCDGPGWSYG